MSDIHGMYDKYIKMLSEINLKESDDLFIIGDSVDIGKNPIKLLKDMSMRSNVFHILGDCEYNALKNMKTITDLNGEIKISDADSFIESLPPHRKTTIKEYMELDSEGRAAIMEYISEMPLLEAISAGDKEYLLVHAGLKNFSADRALDDYNIDELIFDADFVYSTGEFGGVTLVTGHGPSENHGERRKRAFKSDGHIALDCGAAQGGVLCAVCLDNGKEYYV